MSKFTDAIAKLLPASGRTNLPVPPEQKPTVEIGGTGLKVYGGILAEEYQRELIGDRGRKIYKQMAESDPIVRAILSAIGLILRAVDWRVEPANDSAEAEAEAEFVRGVFMDDMSHTFEDFIAEALSMLVYGFSYHEIVLKLRVGPDQSDPSKRSKFTDGRYGIRKMPIRAQETLARWQMSEDGGIDGMWQTLPQGSGELFIPIERALLIRTISKKNSPEGESVLRSAYRPWWLLKTIEEIEAIGIERELAGLPIVRIPAEKLASAKAEDVAFVQTMTKIARDLKFNQQGGVVIPSDMFKDKDGSPVSGAPLVDVSLLTSGGTRAIDTDKVAQRHMRNIARSVLADFIMLGGDASGAYALSKNKTDLFLRACETYLKQIVSPINRFVLPRLWDINGLNRDLMPQLAPGDVAPVDLAELGTFIQQISSAGAPLFPDPDLQEHLHELAGLPAPNLDMDLFNALNAPPMQGFDPATGEPIEQPKLDPKTGKPIEQQKPGDPEPEEDDPPAPASKPKPKAKKPPAKETDE